MLHESNENDKFQEILLVEKDNLDGVNRLHSIEQAGWTFWVSSRDNSQTRNPFRVPTCQACQAREGSWVVSRATLHAPHMNENDEGTLASYFGARREGRRAEKLARLSPRDIISCERY